MNAPRRSLLSRIFQFRIRTLLLLCVVAALLMVARNRHVEKYEDQHLAYLQVADQAVHTSTQVGSPEWLGWLVPEEQYRDVVAVSFHGTRNLRDTDLIPVRKFERLQRLSLHRTPISDDGLKHLSHLVDIDTLSLKFTGITDDGLRHLVGLRRLGVLQLSGTPIDGSGLQVFAGHPQLRRLELSGTQLDDRGLEHVGRFPQLRELDLSRTAIGLAGLRKLRTLQNLESLDVSDTALGADAVDALLELRGLVELHWDNGALEDLSGFVKLSNLRRLRAHGAYKRVAFKGHANLQSLQLTGSLSDVELIECPQLEEVELTRPYKFTPWYRVVRRMPLEPQHVVLRDLPRLRSITWNNFRPVKRLELVNLPALLRLDLIPLQPTLIIPRGVRMDARAWQRYREQLGHLEPLEDVVLEGLSNLRELQIPADLLQGKMLDSLAQLPALDRLDVRTQGDNVAAAVGRFHGLRQLRVFPVSSNQLVSEVEFGDDALAELSELKQLRRLELPEMPITGEGFAALEHLQDLNYLDLTDTQISDEGLAVIARLSQLESLRLIGTQITDASVPTLQAMPQLAEVYLGDSGMTARGIGLLRKARPELKVEVRARRVPPSFGTGRQTKVFTVPNVRQPRMRGLLPKVDVPTPFRRY